jgi:acyl carrier protein
MISEQIVITRKEIRQTLFKRFEAETGKPSNSLTDDQTMAEQPGLDTFDIVSPIMQPERHLDIRLSLEEPASASQVGHWPDTVEQELTRRIEAVPASDDDSRKIVA